MKKSTLKFILLVVLLATFATSFAQNTNESTKKGIKSRITNADGISQTNPSLTENEKSFITTTLGITKFNAVFNNDNFNSYPVCFKNLLAKNDVTNLSKYTMYSKEQYK